MATESKNKKMRVGLCLIVVASSLVLSGAQAATFTVTSTSDSGPGSLRQAILDANANFGADTISFNIPESGPHTIQPASALPFITNPVVIDGYTQPGASPNTNPIDQPINAILQIELDGSTAGLATGIYVVADSSTVRGLVINRFQASGIFVTGSGNVLECNFIGTDVTGMVALGNGFMTAPAGGILLGLGGSNNRVGGTTPEARNLISGNSIRNGVIVYFGSDNLVQGNFIGIDVTGDNALGNSYGIRVHGGVTNTIGGTTLEARNVISGNAASGVASGWGASGTVVQGNYIGIDRTGSVALANNIGVRLEGGLNDIIGGTTAASRNIISGNNSGVYIANGAGGVIQGNFIGTDVAGIADPDLCNNTGVQIVGNAAENTVGGTLPGAGNIISGNGTAISASSTGQGNKYLNNDLSNSTSWSLAISNDSEFEESGNDYSNSVNGVLLQNMDDVSLSHVDLSAIQGGTGVLLIDVTNSSFSNITVSGGAYGIHMGTSSGNIIQNNTVSSNGSGIQLSGNSDGNIIQNNSVSYNSYGIYFSSSSNNQIYNNNFIGNTNQASVSGSSGNIFNLDKPIGGNYWSNWTSPDADGDGFVDIPYGSWGGVDNLPWAEPDGWLCKDPQDMIAELADQVLSLNLQNGISNSLDAKLDTVLQALDDINENNDVAAVNALGAFINAVEAQSGSKIPQADADALISRAQRIIDCLNAQLKARLAGKDEVIGEIMASHVQLKKSLGEV